MNYLPRFVMLLATGPLVFGLFAFFGLCAIAPQAVAGMAESSRHYLKGYHSQVVPCPPNRDQRFAFECGGGFYLDESVLADIPAATDRDLALLRHSKAKSLYRRMQAIQRLFTKAGIPASQVVAAQKFPTATLLQLISEFESGKVSYPQTRRRFIRLSQSYRHHVQFNQLK